MARRITPYLSMLVHIVLGFHSLHAGDIEDGRRVHAATLRLRDEVFDNCIVKMDVSGTYERNSALSGRVSGSLIFARNGACVFSDTATIKQFPGRENLPASDEKTYMQFFMANGRRCIGISYEPTKASRQLKTLSCDPRRSYEDSLRVSTRYVYLDTVLAQFEPTGMTLVELTNPAPSSVKRSKGEALTAVYRTVYGALEVGIERVGDADALTTVRLTQSSTDVYTSLSKGRTLADVRDSILDETSGGLTSVIYAVNIAYNERSTSKPFSTFTVTNHYIAHGKEWHSLERLRLTDYRKCTNNQEIEALRIPIPEGETVKSLDPEYKSLTLAYRGGEVVREVDGASLEQVGVENRRHRIVVYVASALLVLVIVAMLAYIGIRYRDRRKTNKGIS